MNEDGGQVALKGGKRTENGALEIPNTAEQAKQLGNDAFKTGKFKEAIINYTQAIDIAPEWHLPYSNRAMAEAKLSRWDAVKTDATKCIDLSPPGFLKGYYWLGKSLIETQEYNQAMKSLSQILDKVGLEQGQELRTLLNEAAILKHDSGGSVTTDQRKLSMKEFDVVQELGEGNFTTVLHVRHKRTKENFALKCIDKANAKRVSRRHPNIYNEIHMERRALIKFIGVPNIVHLFHTFQDFYSLYYLMELCEGGELWKVITEGGHLVGCHESLARFYLAEITSALVHMHGHGIVHRDIKPENMMLTTSGHVKLIDFGTAKDLVETDLNGPEFVGTPEFMSPQAVLSQECGKEADIWSLGCCVFQFFCGTTPFKAPSPFLAFTRIKMKNHTVLYPEILPLDAKDLIQNLLKFEPHERLGSGDEGVQALQAHPFFLGLEFEGIGTRPALRIPKLKELCIRSFGQYASVIASDYDINVSHEAKSITSKISPTDKVKVMHYLDRRNELKNPRCLRLFHEDVVRARCLKASQFTRSYLGLDYQNQGNWKEPFFFVHIGDPQLGVCMYDEGGGSSWEVEAENLRKAVKAVNRLRPKFVFFGGDMTNANPGDRYFNAQLEEVRTIISKISDSIPVLFTPGNHDVGNVPTEISILEYQKNFGADYYSFWYGGVLNIVLNSCLMMAPEGKELNALLEMEHWLEEQIETSKYSTQHIVVFLHHPFYLNSLDEPDSYVDEIISEVIGRKEVAWPIPGRNRLRFLNLLCDPMVKYIFSGHVHRNNCRVLKEQIKTESSKKQVTREAELENKIEEDVNNGECSGNSSEDTDQDDEGDESPEIRIKMVATGSIGMSLNKNEACGIRIVKVFEDDITDEYFELENIPKKIILEK